jgi:formate-dependent nitrite reductase membrane component NrfD
VVALHERGLETAYLYGAGDEPGEQIAGGLGAFFLLTEPPERFGLPAQADSPIQENGPPATAAGSWPASRPWRSASPPSPRHTGGAMSHAKGPPPEDLIRTREAAREQPDNRDMTPAVGYRGQPATGRTPSPARRRRAHHDDWREARWSFLYDKATSYARQGASVNGSVAAAARRMRGGREVPVPVNGPVINAAVWTWEVPLYFWFGGMATGSSFIALACDAVGDHRSARIARMVTIGAILPGSPLLVMDLGRPMRFLNMLRIFKTRSPMSMGAWCLSAFSAVSAGAVAADLAGQPAIAQRLPRRARGVARLIGRPWLGRLLGAKTAVLGTYLGSYTGVLLAATAVPVWNRSRLFLPPIFICTAMATGAAANRLVLSAAGVPAEHPTRQALGWVETVAMLAELGLSDINERRLGSLGEALETGQPGSSSSSRAGASCRACPAAARRPRRVRRDACFECPVHGLRDGVPVRLGRRRADVGRRPRGGRPDRPQPGAPGRAGAV